jgi:ABC-type lipoprotein release transport system permease subunit
MLTMKRAFKNICRRRFRTALVGIVLALCVAIFASTLASVNAHKPSTATMLTIQVSSGEFGFGGPGPSGSAGAATSTNDSISEDIVNAISEMDGVTSVSASLTYTVGAETSSSGGSMMMGFSYDYMISGVTLTSSLVGEYNSILPVTISEGRNLQEGDDKAVVIGKDLTDYFNAGVGDKISIEGTAFTVVGIYSSNTSGTSGGPGIGGPGMVREDKQVYMNLSTAQNLLDMQGKVSQLTVYASNSSAVDDVVATIQSAYPDLTVFAYKDMQGQFGSPIEQQQ